MRSVLVGFAVAVGFVISCVVGIAAEPDKATSKPSAETTSKPSEFLPGAAAPNVWTGAQKDDVVTASGKTYELTGEYNVGEGKTLQIAAGAVIECDAGSELAIDGGSLVIDGNASKPVIFKGKKGVYGFWNGLTITKAVKAEVFGVQISDANCGVYVKECKPVFCGCVCAGNEIGAKMDSKGKNPFLRDCVLAFNKSDGVVVGNLTTVYFESCTICNNGGCGIEGIYYPSPVLTACIITRNEKCGISLREYESKASVHGSIIFLNKETDVKNLCTNDLDFSGNYWGPDVTKVLQAQGAIVNLPNIYDGRDKKECGKVNLDNFLKTPPKECGSSITKVGNKSVK